MPKPKRWKRALRRKRRKKASRSLPRIFQVPRTARPGPPRGWNLGLKFLSLFLAVLLWFHVRTDRVYTVERAIPLEFLKPADTLVVVGNLPDHVTLQIRATGKALLVLAFDHPRMVVDLRTLKPRRKTRITLAPENFRYPDFLNLEVLRIEPQEFLVMADYRAHKQVPVQARIKGAPAEGFVVTRIEAQPDSVELKGAASYVRRYRRVYTRPVDIENTHKSLRRKVGIEVPDTPYVVADPSQVEVTVTVEPLRRRTFTLPILIKSPPSPRYRLTAEPDSVTVTLEGPESLMDTLSAGRLRAQVRIWKLSEGYYRVPVQVFHPRTLRVVSLEPDTIKVVSQRRKRRR